MKKNYIVLFALLVFWQINSQILNQNAAWPNSAWTVTGTYNNSSWAFEADPRITPNFAFDDDDSGNNIDDDIQATSPVINLTPAFNAMERTIRVTMMYVYNFYSNDVLRIEYWNADTSSWIAWGDNLTENDNNATDNYCAGMKTLFTTPLLNISAFSPNQLSNFKYRIYYNDNPNGAGWNYGFCIDAPVISSVPIAMPDFANIQSSAEVSISYGSQGTTVYGQVYKAGLTDVAPNVVGQAPGIQAWVGYSTVYTNPDTWTNWIPATWDGSYIDNNDQYKAQLGTGLQPGTYYFATRYSLNTGAYVYGGINGFWNASTSPSGILTVTQGVSNDTCLTAIALTPGGVFEDYPVNGTVLYATTGTNVPSCQSYYTSDVWYTVVVPASGRIVIETQIAPANSINDGIVVVYTGSCTNLTPIICNDDGGPSGPNDHMPYFTLFGLTPGITLYIQMAKFGADPDSTTNAFVISAYDDSLSTDSFEKPNFKAHPNPVKDVLNISNSQNIQKIEIVNLLGQEVMVKATDSNEVQVDMSGLLNGVYIVKVTSNNQIKTMKVIKE